MCCARDCASERMCVRCACVCVCSVNKLATNLFFSALKDTMIGSPPLSLTCSASRNSYICATATTSTKKNTRTYYTWTSDNMRAPLNNSFLISERVRACVVCGVCVCTWHCRTIPNSHYLHQMITRRWTHKYMCDFWNWARAAKGWND